MGEVMKQLQDRPSMPGYAFGGAVLWCLVALSTVPAARAAEPPSRTGVDAPELAALGPSGVGVRTLELTDPDQPDPDAATGASGSAPRRERRLTVDLWYPAQVPPGAVAETYTADFPSEPPAPPAHFSVPGLAVRNARPNGGHLPLVIVSHGYSNAPAAMSWLTENLASKGYVVAAIRHEDPPITERTGFPGVLLRRPLDIAFVARSLQGSLGAEGLVDPGRVALVGYSMGGYGVLTAAGAVLDPAGPVAQLVPGGLMLPFARGGARVADVRVTGVKAVVALAPAGGGSLAAWGHGGIAALSAPLLLIAGDNDRTVDYATGARALFDAATGAHRYLLTFKNGGHAIGLNPAPEAMRQKLWDLDWFEDPVWRKDRIIAVNLHMITAFLDRYVKGDESRAAYLEVAVADGQAGRWPAPGPTHYAELSPGTGGVTVWKGFQQKHAAGLELIEHAAAAPAQ